MTSPRGQGYWRGRYKRVTTRRFKEDMENTKVRSFSEKVDHLHACSPSGPTTSAPLPSLWFGGPCAWVPLRFDKFVLRGIVTGTWIPLADGRALAERNNVLDKLRPIFDYVSGNVSPPQAPKHTTNANRAKVPKAPNAIRKPQSMCQMLL